ncbi:MAG: nucleoside monophosphate kinase [Gammaproteobacteria bacterium]
MRIVILGAPGSGKEIQAESLAAEHRIAHLSADELLRAGDGGEPGGERAPPVAGSAENDPAMQLLEERLRERDAKRGIIIEGFPCNIPQAQALDAVLGTHARALQIALHISAGEEQLARRLAGRMTCADCGAIYNREYAPPQKRGKCDDCGGKVTVAPRGGMKKATARIAAYTAEIAPLIAYYKAQHKLRTVAASGTSEEIRQTITDIVDLEIRPLQIKPLETAAKSETFDEEINTVIAGGQISRIATHAPAPAKKAAEETPIETPIESAPPETNLESPNSENPDTEILDAESIDAESPDAENPDAESPDAESPDAESPDAESPDAESPDAENSDAENSGAENPDVESIDSESIDSENPDSENPDSENPDAESPDAESPDAESPDAESPDAKSPDAESPHRENPYLA